MFIVNPYIYGAAAGFTNEKSLLFDGVDEYVDCGTFTGFDSVSAFTFSGWIKFNAVGKYQGVFIRGGNSSNWIQIRIETNDSIRIACRNGGTGDGVSASSLVTTGQWYHIAMVFDGGGATDSDKLKLYLDGSDISLTYSGTIPSTTSSTSAGLIFGYGNSPAYAFDGYMDEFAVFDYALDSTQITDIYNSGTPTDLDNTSGVTAPVHWWRMGDGDTYPTITDVGTTAGNDGTMTNMESGDIVTDTP